MLFVTLEHYVIAWPTVTRRTLWPFSLHVIAWPTVTRRTRCIAEFFTPWYSIADCYTSNTIQI